ncbi:MAG TPA: DsbA family protein [Alphaproteobacteria bacterium]|nr:DsbA family protein [Alphaproteobacteria bacterium]
MSTRTVTLYIDYKSPFAYLAKDPAYDLEQDFGVTLDWRPFTLDIPSFLGAVETRSEQQWRKVKYAYMDARRYANKRGLIVKGPRKIYDSSPASIGMLYAQDAGVFRAYNDLLFPRFWQHEMEIDDVAAIEAVLRDAGADTAGFRDFLSGEGRRRHDEIQQQAIRDGIFGVPSFLYEGELFWGHDRIDFLRERLAA